MAPLVALPAEVELAVPPSGMYDGDSDDDLDFETLRAIERRFALYYGGERCSGESRFRFRCVGLIGFSFFVDCLMYLLLKNSCWFNDL